MKIEKVQNIDFKALLSQIDTKDIFLYYLGKFTPGKTFNSVLRSDKSPSCSIYQDKSGNWRYKDFSDSTNISAISFVMKLFDLSYPQACRKILDDFGVSEFTLKEIVVQKTRQIEEKKETKIQIIPKAYDSRFIEYWNSFGISEETLKLYDIFSVAKLYINKQSFPIKKEEIVACYYFPKSNHCKIYFPLREKGKRFIGNVNNLSDLQGYWQLKIKENKPNLLIITSSMKEIMLLKEYNIASVALNGENHKPIPDLMRHLAKYSGKLMTLMDFDSAGELSRNWYKEQYNIDFIEKPGYLQCDNKDISDCLKYGNKEEITRFIEELKQYGN